MLWNNATNGKIYTQKQKLPIFSMKFCRMLLSEIVTCLCEMQVQIALSYWTALVALLAFVYFSEIMDYVIGPVGSKFKPAVWKELILTNK